MDTLLAVPRYSDLLDDQDHEDESKQGHLLVSSKQGWCMEMAEWIAEAQAAELDEESDNNDIIPCSNTRIAKWKPVTLTNLFGGQDLHMCLSVEIKTQFGCETSKARIYASNKDYKSWSVCDGHPGWHMREVRK